MANKIRGWLPYIGILAVLIVLLVYSQYRQRAYEVQIEPLFDWSEKDLSSIVISKDTLRVELVRTDTAWIFAAPDTGMPGQYRIDDFVRNVLKGQREGYVSEDTSAYQQYGLMERQATKLELMAGGRVVASAFIGRSPTQFSNEYIRYFGDAAIYPLRQRTLNYLGASAAWWR